MHQLFRWSVTLFVADFISLRLIAGAYVAFGQSGPCSNFACKVGTYDNDLMPSTPCRVCPGGYFQNVTNSTTCNTVSSCPAGTWEQFASTSSTDRICSTSPANCAVVAFDHVHCASCRTGYYLSNNQTSCLACSAGEACGDGHADVPCNPGTFSNQAGQAQCTACAAGTVQGNSSQTSCSACLGASYVLPSASATQCLTMDSGFYGVALSGDGYVAEVACTRGYMCVNGSRIACPAGTFQDKSNATSCWPCSTGTFSNATGACGHNI